MSILPLAISIVTALAKLLLDDFKGAFETIKTAVTNLGTTIKNAFGKLMTLGRDLVTGIKNGFVSAWNSFTSTVSNLFSGFISWIKKRLGISSPSTVMAGLGSDTAEGGPLPAQSGRRGEGCGDPAIRGRAHRGVRWPARDARAVIAGGRLLVRYR
jgi:hypothetical protein